VALARGLRHGRWLRHAVLRERLGPQPHQLRQRARATVRRDLDVSRVPPFPPGAAVVPGAALDLRRLSELRADDPALAVTRALVRAVAGVAPRAQAPGLRVLLYHAVGRRERTDRLSLRVSRAAFRDQMRLVIDAGYRVVPLTTLRQTAPA